MDCSFLMFGITVHVCTISGSVIIKIVVYYRADVYMFRQAHLLGVQYREVPASVMSTLGSHLRIEIVHRGRGLALLVPAEKLRSSRSIH